MTANSMIRPPQWHGLLIASSTIKNAGAAPIGDVASGGKGKRQTPTASTESADFDNAISVSFVGVHDFSTGPRRRLSVGSSRSDLEKRNGDASSSFSGTFRCADAGEAFAASWLSTVELFLSNGLFTEKSLSDPDCKWCVTMAAGFVFAHQAVSGLALRTVDMFDFFVHHLSYYEKILSGNYVGNRDRCNLEVDVLRNLDAMERGYIARGYNNPSGRKNGQVLAIMPFYSGKNNKFKTRKFLNISVLSVSHVFPNIVLCVATEEDYRYVTDESGLNEYLYDVMLISGLNGTNYLPLGCNVRARAKLSAGARGGDDGGGGAERSGAWTGFDWVFYTESDQMPHLRDVDRILSLALQHPRNDAKSPLIVPHRGVPYAVREDFADLDKVEVGCGMHRLAKVANKTVHSLPDIREKSCCFRDLYCKRNTGSYQHHFDREDVQLFRQHESWAMIAGTGNVFKETYQVCNLTNTRQICQIG